jgi:hypothetical protein
VKLYQEDDFRAALIEFNRAYELAPNWAVLYNIGQSYYQLRDYAAALRTLEKYSKDGGDRVAPDRREQIDRELAELRGRVAHVTIVVNVEGADLALDDAPIGKLQPGEPILVGAGRHKLTASRPGFAPGSRTLDIAGGDTVTLRFDLAPQTPTPPPAQMAPRESTNYAPALVSAIVGVAGLAAGTIFGVLTIEGKHTLDGECSASKVCPSRAQSDIDAYSRDGTIAGVGFGVGIVGLGLGSYFFFHERGKEGSSGHAGVEPLLGPGSVGLRGSF